MMKIFTKISGHITFEGKFCPEQKAPPKPKVILITIFLVISILGANTQNANFKTNTELHVSFSTEQSVSASVEP